MSQIKFGSDNTVLHSTPTCTWAQADLMLLCRFDPFTHAFLYQNDSKLLSNNKLYLLYHVST